MIRFKQRDIVLISFPFTDLSSSKQRPALVISSDKYNNSYDDLIIVAITSQIPATLSFDEFLIPKDDLLIAGLPKVSLIKLGKIITIHQHIARKKLGYLSKDIFSEFLPIFFNLFSVTL